VAVLICPFIYLIGVLQVFGGEQVTQHRYHCAGSSGGLLRQEGHDYIQYDSRDCPGIDDPTSQNHFPIIDTLLSIPFSLLHNYPRLVNLPFNSHREQLCAMSSQIIYLWWWDPSREMIARSLEIQNQNFAQDDTLNAKPLPIHHQSRRSTTFLTMQPAIIFDLHISNSSSNNLDHGKHTN